jgi:ubiquitin-activating enzyme E1
MEAMGRLVKLRVLIIGMRGLGVETAKNLILAGPASVTIYDPSLVEIEDLSANFYLSEGDVDDETRADASHIKLKALN